MRDNRQKNDDAMRIERRKLTYNEKRDQVTTTLNADFLREIGFEPDDHVNIIYEDIHKVAVICTEDNLSHVLETRANMGLLLKTCKCPTCGSINLDRKCIICDKTY